MTVGIGFEQGRVDIKLSSFRRETRSKDMRLLRRLTGMRDRKNNGRETNWDNGDLFNIPAHQEPCTSWIPSWKAASEYDMVNSIYQLDGTFVASCCMECQKGRRGRTDISNAILFIRLKIVCSIMASKGRNSKG